MEIGLAREFGGSIYGPIELSGTLLALESEFLVLPDPLFFVGFDIGYRFRGISVVDDRDNPLDRWQVPTEESSVLLSDFFETSVATSGFVRPLLFDQYSLVVTPEALQGRLVSNKVLSYR